MRPVATCGKASRSIRHPLTIFNAGFGAGHRFRCPRRYLSQNTNGQIAQLLDWKPESPAKNVVINGYVRGLRKAKQFRFLSLGDGSSKQPLQAVIPRELAGGYGNLPSSSSFSGPSVTHLCVVCIDYLWARLSA